MIDQRNKDEQQKKNQNLKAETVVMYDFVGIFVTRTHRLPAPAIDVFKFQVASQNTKLKYIYR